MTDRAPLLRRLLRVLVAEHGIAEVRAELRALDEEAPEPKPRARPRKAAAERARLAAVIAPPDEVAVARARRARERG